MNIHPIAPLRTALLASGAALLLLSGCGGGGGSDTSGGSDTGGEVSQAESQSMSANSATVPTEATSAMAAALAATETVVANTTDSVTYSCPGGGSAVFTASGASSSDLANGKLDAGESYHVTFSHCQDLSQVGSIDGALNLVVTDASSSHTSISSTTDNLTISVPRGAVTLNGSSTATLTRTVNGSTTTESFHWQTASYSLATAFGTRSSTWTLSNLDLDQSVVWVGSTLSATSYSGKATLSADKPNGGWNITLSFDNSVQYDANGVPESGSWTLALPLNAITVTIADGKATIEVDWWNNGMIDQTYTLTCPELVGLAG